MSSNYRVDWSAALASIRELQLQAGMDPVARMRLSGALREFALQLGSQPMEFGEPKLTLQTKPIVMHVGFNRRFQVSYGVYDARHEVYIRDIVDMEKCDAG